MRRAVVITACVPALLLSACGANYPHVGTLSTTAVKTVATWQPFANDYPQSCRRAWALGVPINSGRSGREPCAAFVDTQTSLSAALTVLSNYFGALGAIATDADYSVDPGLDSLGEAVGKLTDADKASAVTGLVKVIASWSTSGIRRQSLDDALDQLDSVSAIVDGIAHVIVTDYEGQLLKGEGDQLEVAMGTAASDLRLPALPSCASPYSPWGVPQPAGAKASQVMFQSFYNDRCTALLSRKAAVASFRTSAQDLKAALKDLKDNRAKLNTGPAVRAALEDAKKLFAGAQAVRTAFAGSTSDEAKQ